jgi:ankyrin repeat protein
MKHLLITIAAVFFVGCGPKAPDISIHKAARTGNIEAVKQHLDAGADVNAKDGAGLSVLHIAASEGHKEIVELLIDKGADVNAKLVNFNSKVIDGTTPLDWAIKFKNTETADLLRKHGGKTKKELEAAGN